MPKNNRLILFTGILTLIAAFFGYRAIELSHTPASLERMKAIYLAARHDWSALTYVDARGVQTDDALTIALNNATNQHEFLTEPKLQLDEAATALKLAVAGFSSRELSEYLRFRLPVSHYKGRPAMLQWTRTHLEKHTKIGRINPDISADELFKLYWQADTSGGQGYLEGIALNTIKVRFTLNARYPKPDDYIEGDPNAKFAGYQTYYPFFTFADQPDGTKSVDSLCMNLSFVAKVRGDGPLPMLYKCYWSEAEKKWLPHGVMIATVYNRKNAPTF